MAPDSIIVDFETGLRSRDWTVVNDGVMGGLSNSRFEVDNQEFGKFTGCVSLENNGGFASVRKQLNGITLKGYRAFKLWVKGDGKRYQLRIKKNKGDYFSYVWYFTTSDQWEAISVPFDKMVPVFRGQDLNLPNFDGSHIDEIGFLIGNGENEAFSLNIKQIDLK